MYIDYSDLNKACQKDSYIFSQIDQLIDATLGHKLLMSIDALSRYN